MTTRVFEITNSRSGRASTDNREEYERVYSVYGETHGTLAATAAWNYAPSTILNALTSTLLYKQDGFGNPVGVSWKQTTGAWGDCYEVAVEYKNPILADSQRQLRDGEFRITKQTQGGVLHITNSLETIERYTASIAPFQAPDLGQAIGMTREGEVNGVDIQIPLCKTTVDFRFAPGVISMVYAEMLDKMVATVNKTTFLNKPKGDVLFAGYTATNAISNGQVAGPQLSFDFLTQDTRKNFYIGNTEIQEKEGWHYLWVYWKETKAKDPNGGDVPIIVKSPQWIYVERVYEYEDFSKFGLGNMNSDPTGWYE